MSKARLLAAPLLGHVGDHPAALAAHEDDALVEGVEDLLARQAERVQQGGDRQLALAVDADVDDVLGVELEVEPRAAIGDDPGGEQVLARGVGLAAVVVEEHARRAVHLADDHPLGAVDDERAVLRHQRHVAHVDVLLLDIEHGAGLGVRVDLEDDEAERHPHRRRIGHAALAALVGVVFGVFQLVMDEIQLGGAGEVADREDAAQGLLEAGDIAVLRPRAEELLIALALHLDQVRHFRDFVDVAEDLADALRCGGPGLGGRSGGFRHVGRVPLRHVPRRKPGPRNFFVSPAKAGVQTASGLDPGLRREAANGAHKRKKPRIPVPGIAASASYETPADQCVDPAARRRDLFRKAVVRGAI